MREDGSFAVEVHFQLIESGEKAGAEPVREDVHGRVDGPGEVGHCLFEGGLGGLGVVVVGNLVGESVGGKVGCILGVGVGVGCVKKRGNEWGGGGWRQGMRRRGGGG